MKTHLCSVTLAGMVLVLTAAAPAQDSETPIHFRQLPPAVQHAAKEQSAGAVVRGYAKEIEHGRTMYEVELLQDGLTRDLLLDETGAVVEVEQQVKMHDVPPAVQAVLHAEAHGSRITRIESVTRQGKLVRYEAALRKGSGSNTRKSEIAVAPDGSPAMPD